MLLEEKLEVERLNGSAQLDCFVTQHHVLKHCNIQLLDINDLEIEFCKIWGIIYSVIDESYHECPFGIALPQALPKCTCMSEIVIGANREYNLSHGKACYEVDALSAREMKTASTMC